MTNDTIGLGGERLSAGTAQLIIPSDVERSKYLETFIRTGRAFAISDSSEMIEVLVPHHCLNDLEFPKTDKDFGSNFIWVNIPKHNFPVMVGVLASLESAFDMSENQFTLNRDFEGSSVKLTGDAERKFISIEVCSDDNGKLVLKSSGLLEEKGLTKESYFNKNTTILKEGFSLTINSFEEGSNSTSMSYTLGEGLTISDEFGNIIELLDNVMNIKSSSEDFKINLGKGKEPLVLGNTLKSLLEELISALTKATVTTAMGPSSTFVNSAEFTAVNNKLKNFLSDLSNTD